jgi:polysaccharide pyruvyl transferase WcaK-like protein
MDHRFPLINNHLRFDNNSIALNGARHLFNKCSQLDRYIYRQALKDNIDIVLQSELSDFYYSLGCSGDEIINRKCDDVHLSIYEKPREQVSEFLHQHGKIFGNVKEWIEFLKESKCFCLGTRFHGTIAARLAGIPATLITHDSRTLEMAQKMSIPSISGESVDTDSPPVC